MGGALSYGIRELLLDQALNSYFQTWKECYARGQEQNLHLNPDWISEHFKHSENAVFNLEQLDFSEPPWCAPSSTSKENVRIYLLDNGEEVVGVVPYVLDQRQLICGLGELKLVKFPLRVVCLQSRNNVPAETAAYDTLIEQIAKAKSDAVYVNNIRTDSFFWKYLHSSPLIDRSFKFYRRKEPAPHLLIRLEGTFENYMKKFTAKTRKNRFREIRLLEEHGSLQLTRVTRASEIENYLKVAFAISRRTWQFERGWGLRDPEMVRGKMQFLAQRGWLRSYVLKCGDTPCAFILGYQYGLRFYTEFAGADHQWRNQSVGSVILLLVLRDLFQENTPEFYDFGNYAAWQEYYATESYLESSAWLFRRRPYPLVASSIYHTCNVVSIRTGALLQRYRLKTRIRRLLWPRARPAWELPQQR
jgi:hypothetical protein